MKTIIEKATSFCRILELKNSGEEIPYATIAYAANKLLQEEVDETKEAIVEKDYAEILDGFADSAFVALNGIYKTLRNIGYKDLEAIELTENIMHRVCNANLEKIQEDGTVKYNEHGKVQKPEGWKPPFYGDIVS